jgi:hypothetical protein
MEIPGMGMFCFTHEHKGDTGFFVSRFLVPYPLDMLNGPMLIGNKHDQQISVVGLIKRPEHGKLAFVLNGIMHKIIK